MAEQLTAVPFNDLPSAHDGYTVLYDNDKVCKSDVKLSELVGDISSYLTKEQADSLYQEKGDYLSATDSANFYPMTGNPSGFLTAHQSLDGYATQEWVNNKLEEDYYDVEETNDLLDEKLYVSSFEDVSGTFLTAHQDISFLATKDELSAGVEDAKDYADEGIQEIADGLNYLTNYVDSGFINIEESIDEKLDTTAFETVSGDFLTSADLSDYYKKNETSGKEQISAALETKAYAIARVGGGGPLFGENMKFKFAPEGGTNLNLQEYDSSIDAWTDIGVIITKENKGPNKILKTDNRNILQWIDPDYYTKSGTSAASEISAALEGKEDKLTFAGENNTITAINNSAIGGGAEYSAGMDLTINNNVIAVNTYKCAVNSAQYAFVEGASNQAIGPYSHAEGSGCMATDNVSHAEGNFTRADNYSHAEGQSTYANYTSHAEGLSSRATGNYSHAEGSQTSASTSNAHAEGSQTLANGFQSHAEGLSTTAGHYSHAEGIQTSATGQGSKPAHAEGIFTTAVEGAHSEGYYTLASGGNGYYPAAHAEGYKTRALNVAHAEGSNTFASGGYQGPAHTEGYYSSADAKCTHAEGRYTYAHAENSHAEGNGTSAYGGNSHAEGDGTLANNGNAHSEGWHSSAMGNCSHVEGETCVASGSYSHAQNYRTSAIGDASMTIGSGTIAGANNMLAMGKYNKTTDDVAFVIGNGTSNVRSDSFIVSWNGVASAVDMKTSAGNVVATTSTPTANQVLTYDGTDVIWADAQGGGSTDEYVPLSAERCTIGAGNEVNTSTSYFALAQGSANSAKEDAFAQGNSNYANDKSIAQGKNNSALYTSLAQGENNSAYTYSFTQGYANTAKNWSISQGKYNYAEQYTVVNGTNNSAEYFSIAVGDTNSANQKSLAVGMNNTASYMGVVIGVDNSANMAFACGEHSRAVLKSVAIGFSASAANIAVAMGDEVTAYYETLAQGSRVSAKNVSLAQGSNVTANEQAFSQGMTISSYGNSFAQGQQVTAANTAMAQGVHVKADNTSFAQGYNVWAIDGGYSFGQGNNVTATNSSMAQGVVITADSASFAQGTTANATLNSFAQGQYVTASNNSFAQGGMVSADGGSFVQGIKCTATNASMAQGQFNIANNCSQTLGHHLKANNYGLAIGGYNDITNAAFVIGNGTSEYDRSDLFVIQWDGTVSGTGNIYASGGQVVTDVMLTSATNSSASFVTNGVADLTPLYTYIKSLEDRIAALEAAQGGDGITVNDIQPTVNGNTITVGE